MNEKLIYYLVKLKDGDSYHFFRWNEYCDDGWGKYEPNADGFDATRFETVESIEHSIKNQSFVKSYRGKVYGREELTILKFELVGEIV